MSDMIMRAGKDEGSFVTSSIRHFLLIYKYSLIILLNIINFRIAQTRASSAGSYMVGITHPINNNTVTYFAKPAKKNLH